MNINNINDFRTLVEKERARKGINISAFCKLINIQRSHYYEFIKGNSGIGFSLVIKMCEVLKLPITIGQTQVTQKVLDFPVPEKIKKPKKKAKKKKVVIYL